MSLRVRLLVVIGIALAVLWSGAAAWMLRDLDRSLQTTLDERLAMSARMVSALLTRSALSEAGSPIRDRGSLIVPGNEAMACQVRTLRGEIVATTRDPARTPWQGGDLGYQMVWLDGERWRTYTLRAGNFYITTADRLDERALLRRRTALAAGIPFLIAGFGGLAALWVGVGRALSPLRELQRKLGNRRPDELEPLQTQAVPPELGPLVRSLNGLLDRIAQSIQRERNFTNDAAHELRTPLTAIDTHLQVARLTQGEDAARALQDAATGVARMRSTLDQLLVLARLEGRASFEDGERITARDALDRALATQGAEFNERLLISMQDVRDRPLDIPATMAVVALRNLIDNALKYSPMEEPVEIEVLGRDDVTIYRIRDRGAGMSDDELAMATQRFWRREHGMAGVGLGLTLVKVIVERFSGGISLQRNPAGGLLAELTLRHVRA